MQKRKSTYKTKEEMVLQSDTVGALWTGIKTIGTGAAVLVLGALLAVLASQATLIAYLKFQPDGETEMVSKYTQPIWEVQ